MISFKPQYLNGNKRKFISDIHFICRCKHKDNFQQRGRKGKLRDILKYSINDNQEKVTR